MAHRGYDCPEDEKEMVANWPFQGKVLMVSSFSTDRRGRIRWCVLGVTY